MGVRRREALAGGLSLAVSGANADTWPSKPIRMIVPYGPGSAADTIARVFADQLTKSLGQVFIVDNKFGAGGIIATAEAARAPADGYTLLASAQGTMVFNMELYKAPGYDPLKDFAFVTRTAQVANVLAVTPKNPARTVADLISQARSRPEEVTYASAGVGTSGHLCAVLLEHRTGTKLQHVPYRGTPAAILAVVNGEVTCSFFNVPSVVGLIRDGKLRALAVTSEQRSEVLPKLPTMIEDGFENYVVTAWLGFALPAKTSQDIVMKLNTEINRISQLPELKASLLAQGVELFPPASPAVARRLVEEDTALWLPLIKESGAKAE